MKIISSGVCAAKGFKASGVYCAIKENPTKKNDIALIVSDVMCNAAGVYTSNKVKGAPVVVTKKNLEKSGGKAKAVIVNSKNANTCNADGEEKAVTTVTWDQKATGTLVGEYFVNYVKENNGGKCRVVELTNAVSTHCQERFVGLHEVIDAANADGCEIESLNKYDSQGNRETAYNAISAIVEPYDYIISDVDNGAMGAVAALQAVGNTDVKVFSMGAYGAEPFGKLHDNDVNYQACLNVDAWVLAQFIYEGAISYFEGKDVPTKTNIDLFVVDGTNVEKFWSFD